MPLSRSTYELARSAFEEYFEPLSWLGSKTHRTQAHIPRGERLLEPRHVIGLFLLVMSLSGLFFTIGYMMGKRDVGVSAASPILWLSQPVPKGVITLQIAEVNRTSDAAALAEKLRQVGFSVLVIALDENGRYSVEVGPYIDVSSAEHARTQLKAKGYEAKITQ